MPLVTPHVSGAQLAFTQPVKSRPLKSGTKPSLSAASAVAAVISRDRKQGFMPGHCQHQRENARPNGTGPEGVFESRCAAICRNADQASRFSEPKKSKFFLVRWQIKGDVLAQRVRTETLRVVLWKSEQN